MDLPDAMSNLQLSLPSDFSLPRRKVWEGSTDIAAPSYESFTSRFGHAFPKPEFIKSDLGTTAIYDLKSPSGSSKRPVVIIHGINTPALGMWPLAKELQLLDPDAHVVLFDLWGHGLSSAPLTAHTPQIFHFQIFQVLAHMGWTNAELIGFSFGGITAVKFALHNPKSVSSVALLAPAGLLSGFSKEMQDHLDGSTGRDKEAIDYILSWLEGGPLIVPADWKERVKSGEVVAEALREWELQEHAGYRHSVLSMMREGGVYGCEDDFRKLATYPFTKVGVVGELDPVCSKSQLVDLGIENVEIIEKADHGLVRTMPAEIARIVYDAWVHPK